MRLRCFLCRYGDRSERLRWYLDDGAPWCQQVFSMVLPDGPLVHTGSDPTAVSFLEGFERLIESGQVEEL